MTPDDFVAHFARQKVSAILRTDDQRKASEAMNAAIRGGFRIAEFTLTIPGVHELISDFAGRDDLVVGAGTVLSAADAREAVRAGAQFLVSPVVDEEVIAAAHALGVAVMPGVHTPTELLRAHRAGAQLQKLFPAPMGGPAWVRSVMGPLPFARIVPTNGTDAHNARDWLDAGAHALGFVASVFDRSDIAREDWASIESRAREIMEAVA